MNRPLLAYGVLELGIAAAALAVPVLLDSVEPLYQAIYRTSYSSYLNLSLARFALTFLMLLVPTTFMGATLPLVARFLVRQRATAGSRIGSLYATNTVGAVMGTFLAGFVFIA